MKKSFTPEEVTKSHETNVKAAASLYILTGVLCSVYTVRYFITGNFNFYFKLAFPDMFLKLGDSGEIPHVAGTALAVICIVAYLVPGALLMKKTELFPLAAAILIADTLCLLFCDFVLWGVPTSSDFLIDIICHLWVLLFVVVGLRSARTLKKQQA